MSSDSSKSNDHCIRHVSLLFFVSVLVLLNTREHSSQANGVQPINCEAQLHSSTRLLGWRAYAPRPVQFHKETYKRQPVHTRGASASRRFCLRGQTIRHRRNGSAGLTDSSSLLASKTNREAEKHDTASQMLVHDSWSLLSGPSRHTVSNLARRDALFRSRKR